ncbi:MAG: TerB family tellurite resistance protein [Gemmatimonadales bacterium]|nr:TerB family tellurite resistance protein [Gemmatimonadales bacterium]
MLDAIRGFVTRNILRAPEAAPPTDPRAPSGGIQLAACALLLELAHADGELSPDELAHIESALGRHFGVEPATAAELIALAEAERSQSIDHFQFTRLIARQYDLGQKMVLAEVMWGVILADGQIAQHEATLVRKLASLLDLEPAYLAQARSAAATSSSRST